MNKFDLAKANRRSYHRQKGHGSELVAICQRYSEFFLDVKIISKLNILPEVLNSTGEVFSIISTKG